MVGRKKKLVDNITGHRTKEEKLEREKEQKLLKGFEPLENSPPSWLDEQGKEEFERIVPLLQQLPIAELDKTMIALYCNAYSKYITATADVDEHGITIIESTSTGDKKKKNPALVIMSDMGKEIRSIANTLGMTIDGRMRLMVPPKQIIKDDPYNRFDMDDDE
ncbi:phage terminase small subunit P27 family [Niallia sp. 03091]|uniref:phage terminase small subunit P27 family n=1 Tax=Niallia sp. 03091 TaxID=3458059 RepID=UPI00404426BF